MAGGKPYGEAKGTRTGDFGYEGGQNPISIKKRL